MSRARTLSRGTEDRELAALERSLAAQLEILDQADAVEDHLTQLTARLLEVGALAARCRVELLAPDADDLPQRLLMDRLGTDLGHATRAAAEISLVAFPQRG